MDKETKGSVKYAITAHDLWIDLEERFNKENTPMAYELRRTITAIHQERITVSILYQIKKHLGRKSIDNPIIVV